MNSNSTVQSYLRSSSQWLILVALGFAMSRTSGTYGLEFILLVIGALFFFLAGLWGKDTPKAPAAVLLLKGTTLFFLGRLCARTSIFYPISDRLVIPTALVHFAFFSTLFFLWKRRTQSLVLAGGALVLALLSVPYVSPHPQIDVFTITNEATQHLLNGRNPYSSYYADTFSKSFGYKAGYGWWPASLITTTLASFIADFRWIFAIALVLSAVFVTKVSLSFGHKKEYALLFGLLWLSFPVNPMIVEMAWVDPLLIVSAAFLAWGLVKRNLWLIALALGYHISVKQYGLITLTVTFFWLWRRDSFKFALKALAISVLVFLTFTLPFFLQGPSDFIHMAFLDIMGVAPRDDSFTIYALLKNQFNFHLADYWTVFALLGTLLFFFIQWSRKKPNFSDWSLCLFLTLCLGFLFARRAFCNYFHFSSYFLVLYLVSIFGEKNARTS